MSYTITKSSQVEFQSALHDIYETSNVVAYAHYWLARILDYYIAQDLVDCVIVDYLGNKELLLLGKYLIKTQILALLDELYVNRLGTRFYKQISTKPVLRRQKSSRHIKFSVNYVAAKLLN